VHVLNLVLALNYLGQVQLCEEPQVIDKISNTIIAAALLDLLFDCLQIFEGGLEERMVLVLVCELDL